METIEQARSVMMRIDGLIINDQVVIINYAKGVITNEFTQMIHGANAIARGLRKTIENPSIEQQQQYLEQK
ncbi:MAG: hypothetical protein EZS28_049254, partial [Streblomastix strix]